MKRISQTLWCLLAVMMSGCGVNHDSVVRKHGGYANLKVEAAEVFNSIDTNGSQAFSGTNLPPVMAALKPQFVNMHELNPPVLNIQTLGGFNHQGLLIVLGTNTAYRPETGHGWVRKELAPGVWEYRE